MRCVRGLLVLSALVITACGNDGLESDPDLQPPAGTEAYDPSDGQGEGGGYYSTTSGQGTVGGGDETVGGGDETGGSSDDSGGGVVACEEDNRRCLYTFELANDGYETVELLGSFAEDGWERPVPMALDDETWRASVGVSWGEDTEYRFRIDGSGDWVLDPDNDETVNDNSLVPASMCEDYSCRTTPANPSRLWTPIDAPR